MMLSMAGFSFNDALIKSVSGGLPLFQAIFLRGVVAVALIGALVWVRGTLRFQATRRDWRLMVQRCVGEIGGTLCFLTALFHMPIANATAILQSVPLAVTLGAAFFLGEAVGWRRYLAISIGFLGVLIIVRPGAEGFDGYAFWAMGSIVFIVLRDLSTRRLSPAMPALAVVLITAVAITSVSGVLALVSDWRPVTAEHVMRLSGSAVFLSVGYLFGVMTMRLGEIGFVQPFRYTLLLWSMLLGVLMFGEWPDAVTLGGSAVVVSTGLFTFYRERKLGRVPRTGAREATGLAGGVRRGSTLRGEQ
jgi:drug/metabolite transporter (DMT)-like permease